MCELFGMNAAHPTDVNHSLAVLRPRGGSLGPHADGWGVAFYEERASRVFKEPVPASESRCLAFISEYGFRSSIVIGHIRKANPPNVGRSAANTHPFSRELGGRSWVFAHNGVLPGIAGRHFEVQRFQPMGATDSEHAFCFLLDHVARNMDVQLPQADALATALQKPIEELSALGEFNFLMSDGIHLVAFANTKLSCIERRCMERQCNQRVIVLATAPLTTETWNPLQPNRLHVFRNGTGVALG